MYQGLPVVILQDWSELCEVRNFDKWGKQYGHVIDGAWTQLNYEKWVK